MDEIKASQTVVATAVARDTGGNPAAMPGPVEWSTDAPDVLAIIANADGTCTVRGRAMGRAKLHARSGDVVGEVDIQVTAGAAAYLEITLAPFPAAGGRSR